MEQSSARRSALILRAVRAHWNHSPLLVTLWLIGNIVTIAMPIGITWSFGLLVGGVAGAITDGMNSAAGHQFWTGVTGLIVMDLVHSPFGNLAWKGGELAGIRNRGVHRRRIMQILAEPEGVAHMHDAKVLDAAKSADNYHVTSLLTGVGNVVGTRVRGLGAAGLLAIQSPLAGAVLAIAWLVYGRWSWRKVTADSTAFSGESAALRRSDALHTMATSAATAKEVRIFGLARFFSERFVAEWRRGMEHVWEIRKRGLDGAIPIALMLVGAHAFAFGLVGWQAASGAITVTALATALQAGLQSSQLGSVPHGQWDVEYGLATIPALDRLQGAVDAVAVRLDGTLPAPVPRERIRIRDLTFRYPGGEKDVLQHLDLDIRVGSSVAIVGANGAGKTTLVNLLARLWDPNEGTISIDDVPLTDIRPHEWQRRVAVVSQNPLRLPLTVRENLACGRDADDDMIWQALRRAGAESIVAALPDRLDTVLDRGFEGGAELSGGQWQRLALARALVAVETDADVLILDEPTAHLDARAEADLYARFLELTSGRTTVVVSHRFSTVRRADLIVVISNGRIAETGTHDELVALGGYYARAFKVQAARFATT